MANRVAYEDMWTATTMPLEQIEESLGRSHVEWLKSLPHPGATAVCRAAGAWTANERESYCAYRSLARHLGEVSE